MNCRNSHRWGRAFARALLAVASLGTAARANDACTSCTSLPIPGTMTANTCTATTDGAATCAPSGHDYWYCIRPTCGGLITIDTCGSNFDTVLSVHTACGPGAPEIACNNDSASCGLQSRVEFMPSPCTTYFVRVAGIGPAACGTAIIHVAQAATQPPANDTCANAQSLPGPGMYTFSSCGATGGPVPGCAGTNDVWFRFFSTCSGTTRVDTCGSCFDTVLTVYQGGCANPSLVVCGDDFLGGGPHANCIAGNSAVTFQGVTGVEYLVRVAGSAGATGFGQLTIECVTPPGNDTCGAALPIRPGETVQGSTVDANTTVGVGGCSGTLSGASRDVWYVFTPAAGGAYTLDTCQDPTLGGAFDTVISVYSGCDAISSPPLACGDNGCGVRSQVTFTSGAGECSVVRVSGVNAQASGGFALRASSAPVTPPPMNDESQFATAVGAGVFDFTTAGASTDGPPAQDLRNDVWFRYTAPCGGTVAVSTCDSPAGTDSGLAVYSGSGALTLIAQNNNAPSGSPCAGTTASYLTFTSAPGMSYLIRVGSPAVASGTAISGRLTINGAYSAGTPTCAPGRNASATHLNKSRFYEIVNPPAQTTVMNWCVRAPCCSSMSGSITITPSQSLLTIANNLASSIDAVYASSCGAPNPPNTKAMAIADGARAYVLLNSRTCTPTTPIFLTVAFGAGNGDCEKHMIVSSDNPGVCAMRKIIIVKPDIDDCNNNGVPDSEDINSGTSGDENCNGVPDECEAPPGIPPPPCGPDYNANFETDSNDVALFLNTWFGDLIHGTLNADFNDDAEVNSNDVAVFLNLWFAGCP